MFEHGPLHRMIYKRLCGHFFLEPNNFEFDGVIPIPKLIVAACSDDTDQLQYLIAAGHNLEIRELYSGKTSLMMAAAWGNYKNVKKLIESGADLNNTDVIGLSAMEEANLAGHQEIVALLLEAGALPVVNFVMHPEVALYMGKACAQAKEIFSIAFLQKKAAKNLSFQEATNQPAKAAPGQNLISLQPSLWLEDFRTGKIIEENNEIGHRLVFVEVSDRSQFIKYFFRLFVFRGEEDTPILAINLETSSSLSPDFCMGKHIGNRHETIYLVDCLTFNEFKNRAIRIFKETVGLLPCSKPPISDSEKLYRFLKKPDQESEKDFILPINLGNTPAALGIAPRLVLAAYENNIAELKRLIAAGHPIDMKDSTGKTALIMAARWGNQEIVKILLENGANSNCVDIEGFSALDEAVAGNHTEIVKLLKPDFDNENISAVSLNKEVLTTIKLSGSRIVEFYFRSFKAKRKFQKQQDSIFTFFKSLFGFKLDYLAFKNETENLLREAEWIYHSSLEQEAFCEKHMIQLLMKEYAKKVKQAAFSLFTFCKFLNAHLSIKSEISQGNKFSRSELKIFFDELTNSEKKVVQAVADLIGFGDRKSVV